MEWAELLNILLTGTLTIAMGFLVKFLSDRGIIDKLQKIKVSDEVLKNASYTAVLFVQQYFYEMGGEERYNKASEYLSNYLSSRGINISDEEIRMSIESSLKEAKKAFGDQWGK